MTIWEGAAYDAAGNWTQQQLEAAVAAAITSDASKVGQLGGAGLGALGSIGGSAIMGKMMAGGAVAL